MDYSEKSLAYVDKTLNYFHTARIKNANVETAIGAFGCYVGEVFVRNLKGSWLIPTDAEKAALGDGVFVKLPGGVLVNPIGKVHKLVENGMEDSVVWLYKVSEQKSR